MKNPKYTLLNETLSLEAVKVCEQAAISAYGLMGRGDENGADAQGFK